MNRTLQSKDKVEVRQSDGVWREGNINKKERNGSYTIFYSNGEMDFNVSNERIRYKPNTVDNYNHNDNNYNSRQSRSPSRNQKSSLGQDYQINTDNQFIDNNHNITPTLSSKSSGLSTQILSSPSRYSTTDNDYFGDESINGNGNGNNRSYSCYKVGSIVNASFGNSSNFTRGEIIAIHSDDTYTVKCIKTNILKRLGSEKLQSLDYELNNNSNNNNNNNNSYTNSSDVDYYNNSNDNNDSNHNANVDPKSPMRPESSSPSRSQYPAYRYQSNQMNGNGRKLAGPSIAYSQDMNSDNSYNTNKVDSLNLENTAERADRTTQTSARATSAAGTTAAATNDQQTTAGATTVMMSARRSNSDSEKVKPGDTITPTPSQQTGTTINISNEVSNNTNSTVVVPTQQQQLQQQVGVSNEDALEIMETYFDENAVYDDVELGVYYNSFITPAICFPILVYMNSIFSSSSSSLSTALENKGRINHHHKIDDDGYDNINNNSLNNGKLNPVAHEIMSALPYGTDVTIVPMSDYLDFQNTTDSTSTTATSSQPVCTYLIWQGEKVTVPIFMKLKLVANIPKLVELKLYFYVKGISIGVLKILVNTTGNQSSGSNNGGRGSPVSNAVIGSVNIGNMNASNIDQYYASYYPDYSNNSNNQVLTTSMIMYRSIYLITPSFLSMNNIQSSSSSPPPPQDTTAVAMINYIFNTIENELPGLTVYEPDVNPAYNLDKIKMSESLQFVCIHSPTVSDTAATGISGNKINLNTQGLTLTQTTLQRDQMNAQIAFSLAAISSGAGSTISSNLNHNGANIINALTTNTSATAGIEIERQQVVLSYIHTPSHNVTSSTVTSSTTSNNSGTTTTTATTTIPDLFTQPKNTLDGSSNPYYTIIKNNQSPAPELVLYKWLFTFLGGIQDCKLRLLEGIHSLNCLLTGIKDRYIPIGMLYLPIPTQAQEGAGGVGTGVMNNMFPYKKEQLLQCLKDDLLGSKKKANNTLKTTVTTSTTATTAVSTPLITVTSNVTNSTSSSSSSQSVSGQSTYQLFFCCEDQNASSKANEHTIAHSPLSILYHDKFFLHAYPFLKATIAVLLYVKLNHKESSTSINNNSNNSSNNNSTTTANSSTTGSTYNANTTATTATHIGSLHGYSFPVPYNVTKLALLWDEETLLTIWNFYEQKMKMIRGKLYRTSPSANNGTNNIVSTSSTENVNVDVNQIEKSFAAIKLLHNESSTMTNMMNDYLNSVTNCVESSLFTLHQLASQTSNHHHHHNNNNNNHNHKLSQKTYQLKFILDQLLPPRWIEKTLMRPVEINQCTYWISKPTYDKKYCHLIFMLDAYDTSILNMMIQHIVSDVGIKNKQTAKDISICLRSIGYDTWEDILRITQLSFQSTYSTNYNLSPIHHQNTTSHTSPNSHTRQPYQRKVLQDQQISLSKTFHAMDACFTDVGISSIAISKFIQYLQQQVQLNINAQAIRAN